MLIITPLLVEHDTFTLSVMLTLHDAAHGLASVRVRDRFDTVLAERTFKELPKVWTTRCDRVPRGRFPLFVEAVSSDATTTTLGPLYPAPTDAEYARREGAVALPRPAIDTLNDDTIRKLRASVTYGNAIAASFDRSRDSLRHRRDGLRPATHTLTLAATIMSSTSALLLSVSERAG